MRRILVVEDDKYFNKLLSDHFHLEGFDVESALDGEAALAKLESAYHDKKPFDIALVDMLLPKKMGAELFTRINESDQYETLEKHAMSGIYKNADEIKQLKILFGLKSYWTKPFNLKALTAEISGVQNETESSALPPSGDLSDFPVEVLFYTAYSQAFTGRLTISRDQKERRVYFLHGHPIAADSTAISESFGQALVSMKYIDQASREKASRKMVEEQKHFGEVLVEDGLITKDDLFRALRKHTYQLLLNSFLSRQGQFRSENLPSVPNHLPRIEFNPFLLMLEAQEKLISIEALAALYNLRMNEFPMRHERWRQLIVLLNLPMEVLIILQTLKEDACLRDTLKSIQADFREKTLRTLYLMESIQMLEWSAEAKQLSKTEQVDSTDFYESENDEAIAPAPSLEEVDNRIFSRYMDTLNQNYFELLGIPKDSSEKEIRDAYRKVRYENHPDRYGDQISGQSQRILDDILSRLDQSFQILSDPQRREEYINTLNRISEDSAADSKRYLEALDLFRDGKKLLESEKFLDAKKLFEKAHDVWKSGIEYKMYAAYAQLKQDRAENPKMDSQKAIQNFRELVYAHPHSELGFLLLGHLYRSGEHYEAAREAYTKGLQVNPGSEEMQNALARLASEDKKKIKLSGASFKLPRKALKKIALIVVLAASGLAFQYQGNYFQKTDSEVLELSPSALKEVMPALIIRKKLDVAKVTVEAGWTKKIPEPVLKSKCAQAFEKIGVYGIQRLFIIEKERGLTAFCTHEFTKKY